VVPNARLALSGTEIDFMKLVIALATRGRPALLRDTLRWTLPNITEGNTQLIVMADADDAPTMEVMRDFPDHADRLIFNVHEREDTVAEKFNRALRWNADVYTAMVDHTHITTKGFDAKILEAATEFPDGIAFVFNHHANLSFIGTYSWTRKAADHLGYLFPPYFPYWFIDHWIDDIARMVDRVAFADVVSDSSRKQPTQEMREPGWWATWFDAGFLWRRRIAQSIIDSDEFQEPEHRRRVLQRNFPLIEGHSRLVNSHVRGQDMDLRRASALSNADPRYLRMKEKAIALLPSMLEGMEPALANAYRDYLIPPTVIPALKRAFA
jgi:hypothetical protein